MIRIIDRSVLQLEKYNTCIEKSMQSKIYAFSWYLDCVVDHWEVLVLDDYKAVMPIPKRKKMGISYVYPPFWILQLGIFSAESVDETLFIEIITKRFKWVELRLNEKNFKDCANCSISLRDFQVLNMQNSYQNLYEAFRKDRRKDLRKAAENQLVIEWDDCPEKLVQLFQNNIGKRTPEIKRKDYQRLLLLLNVLLEKKLGETVAVYSKDRELLASSFVLFHKQEITILLSSTNLAKRNNGSNTFLINALLQKYHGSFEQFNFGGSSIPSVASYFKSFAAITKTYPYLQNHRLPKALLQLRKVLPI